jgi:nucleoside-diphosphate-sugar epimerase
MTFASPLGLDLDAALENAEDDLRALAGGRLLVTGGSGFVGSWLLELLAWGAARLDLDLQVVTLSRHLDAWAARMPHLALSPVISPIPGDARSFTFPDGEFAAVVLGAASSDKAWTMAHPAEVIDIIENGTRRGLAFADVSGASRALLLSSGAVYGHQPPDLPAIPEDAPSTPSNDDAYATAKKTAECLIAAWSVNGRGAVIARIFNVFGPYQPQDTHFAIANFIADAVAGRPVTVHGDGSPVRSYLYGADLAVALLACLVRGRPGSTYNVGGNVPIRLGDLAALVASLASPPVEVRILGKHDPIDRYVPDVRRLTEELRFAPATSLADGVRRTIAWAAHGTTGG